MIAIGQLRDLYSPEMSHLNATASHVLDEHTHGDDTYCTVCNVPWPCPKVLLAEHNLAGF